MYIYKYVSIYGMRTHSSKRTHSRKRANSRKYTQARTCRAHHVLVGMDNELICEM